LVIVEKEKVKKTFWPLGVVEELIESRGGVVRKAVVRTSDGCKTHTLQHLFPLEVNAIEEAMEDAIEEAMEDAMEEAMEDVMEDAIEDVPEQTLGMKLRNGKWKK